VQSREVGGRIFPGAAVRVTKTVQRTFEFVNGAAAAEAMVTMLMHTKGTDAHKFARKKLGVAAEEDDENQDEEEGQEEEEEVWTPAAAMAAAAAAGALDPKFGLEHGGCLFQVSRPLAVALHGLSEEHGEVTLPNADAIRLAVEGDSVPPEASFPTTTRWDGGKDPATQTEWDQKSLASDGMPIRFQNNRRHCAVVYKLLRFEDIDTKAPKPIKGSDFAPGGKHRMLRMRSTSLLMASAPMDIAGTDLSSASALQKEAQEGDNDHKGTGLVVYKGTGPHRDDPVVVHLRPGEVGWVRAPPGVYHLRLAEGRKWFGSKFQFGPSVAGWGGSASVVRKVVAAAAAEASGNSGSGGGNAAATTTTEIEEPFSNYGTSKWQYPPLWLYRTRSGRWCITLDDPTLPITTVGVKGELLTRDEQAALRDELTRDMGLYRTRSSGAQWPDGSGSTDRAGSAAVGGLEWEVLNGPHDTSADAEDSDGSSDSEEGDDGDGDGSVATTPTSKREGGKKTPPPRKKHDGSPRKRSQGSSTKKEKKQHDPNAPWQPFPGLRVVEDADDSSGSTLPQVQTFGFEEDWATPLPEDGEGELHNSGLMAGPTAGPAGFLMTGVTMLVGGRGTFLRMAAAHDDGEGGGSKRSSRHSFAGGVTSAERPLLVHGAPVYKYDPRFQFLKDIYSTWKQGGGGEMPDANSPAVVSDKRGRAGPKEGAWWWELRADAPSKRAFARETLAMLDAEADERSEFVRMWHASTFEVPEKRIRTVIWPQSVNADVHVDE